MIFIRDMVIGKKNIKLLDDVSFVFVPVFNVDGHENFTALNRINQNGPRELGTRNTSQQHNLNRDFLKADAPEMKAWLKMYNYWLPELFIDVHVTNGADFQYVMTYAIDNMTSNMEPGITKWSQEVYEKQLCEQMEKAGFPIFLYGSFKKYNAPESGFVPDTFDPSVAVAVIVTVPSDFDVTTPLASTVATASLLDFHVIGASTSLRNAFN
jgi:hypothetical protein